MMQNPWKNDWNGYSSERTGRELSNEYQHDSVWIVTKILCVLVLWTNVASALKGLIGSLCLTCRLLSFWWERFRRGCRRTPRHLLQSCLWQPWWESWVVFHLWKKLETIDQHNTTPISCGFEKFGTVRTFLLFLFLNYKLHFHEAQNLHVQAFLKPTMSLFWLRLSIF